MKKAIKIILSVILCIILLAGICVGGFFLLYTPSLTADFSQKTGEVTNGASGYLYGLAESGVPSSNMTESVDISTVSQKVVDGLQHPIGDIDNVYSQLDNTDYDIVYLQDAYSTWYYEQSNIEEMRANDEYDWQEFITEDYFPKVKEAVTYLSSTSYSDKVVYCLYNECDNGVWFGETQTADNDYGVSGVYNEQGAQNFFEAWKMTYDYVRSINPDALIGGPGFCDYNSDEISAFLTYCAENDCVPDVMIYHELSDDSIRFWQQHVSDYRQIEQELGIEELPIVVTEYGRMCDNGLPGKMLQYITQIEYTKVYGDNAYWRLADNLCDVAADDNSPNSNWWLYRWYTDMEGQTVYSKYNDLFNSNFENAFIKRKAEYTSWGFMGVVSITDDEDEIDVICGGRDGFATVKLKNLDETNFKNTTVKITVEEVVYKGISGVVNSPRVVSEYYETVGSKLNISLDNMSEENAYKITVVPVESKGEDYENETYIERYEFENGTLLGNAYTYDSAYATTGEESGMIGGMENEGDGVEITFTVPEDKTYTFDIIYGNSNDGEYDEDGKQNPNDRVDSVSIMTLDGEECEISFANTIKSEYTDCLSMSMELTAGEHTLSFKHSSGTIVLDSLLVSEETQSEIAVLKDSDRTDDETQSYLIVAPSDGYYDVSFSNDNISTAYINDNEIDLSQGNTVYFCRGLNYLDVKSATELEDFDVTDSENAAWTAELDANSAKLSDGAVISTNSTLNVDYIDGISCNSGTAQFTVTAPQDGTYAVTFLYSNNDEGGKHAYNVDLIERYVTISANGVSQDVYCRNTYSWDTYKTVTAYIQLNEGDNTITLTNSGNTKFDNQDTYAPYISNISVCSLQG
ncbi:MAG: hypothetical protein LIO62_09280 [Clostridiales bacterium]|nr:hypothetical protein [Clostridiales bacterium]